MDPYLLLKKINLDTDFPVATTSPDYECPWGTARDSSRNSLFNAKIYRLFRCLYRFPRILDLGCSGGGFVRNCLDDGCLAVGVEGSDYSKRFCRAEWGTLADKFLFTADITKRFFIDGEFDLISEALSFDVITLWEVLEHLREEDLPIVCENIRYHLHLYGIVVVSITTAKEVIRGTHLHQTIKEKKWWIDFFHSQQLYYKPEIESYFCTQFIRGPKQDQLKSSFNLVLVKDPNWAIPIPKSNLGNKMYYWWHGSKVHQILKEIFL